MPTHDVGFFDTLNPQINPDAAASVDASSGFQFQTFAGTSGYDPQRSHLSRDQWAQFEQSAGYTAPPPLRGPDRSEFDSATEYTEELRDWQAAKAQWINQHGLDAWKANIEQNNERAGEGTRERGDDVSAWQAGLAILATAGFLAPVGGAPAATTTAPVAGTAPAVGGAVPGGTGAGALTGVTLPASTAPIGSGFTLPGVAGTGAEVLGTTGLNALGPAASGISGGAEAFPNALTGINTSAIPSTIGGGATLPGVAGTGEDVLAATGLNALGPATSNVLGNTSGGGEIPWWAQLGFDTLQGALAAGATEDAANAALAGNQAAIDELARQFDLTRGDLAPFREVGTEAINRLGDIYGGPQNDPLNPQPDFSNFFTSPGFEFRRDEGLRTIGNQFSARGTALSGNALRELTNFNSGLASGEFGNFFNQQAALAGIGQTATNTTGILGANTAAQTGNFLGQQGSIRGSGILGQNSIWNNVINNALDNFQNRSG